MKATNNPLATGQSGVMLLEALIAILIFSLGILSLVALQATAVQLTSDAKYRTDATLLRAMRAAKDSRFGCTGAKVTCPFCSITVTSEPISIPAARQISAGKVRPRLCPIRTILRTCAVMALLRNVESNSTQALLP